VALRHDGCIRIHADNTEAMKQRVSYLHAQQEGKSGGNVGQRSSMLTTTGDRWIRCDFMVSVPPNMTSTKISLQLRQTTSIVLVDDVSL
jgi:hypothetical protein